MNITKVNVNGTDYYIKDTISGYTSFEISNRLTTSTQIGVLTFNGVSYPLYAPDQTMSNTLNIYVTGTNLIFDNSN